jgi:hypothetical protein
MEQRLRRRVRILLGIVICGLVLSGVTAFPLESELRWLTEAVEIGDAPSPADGPLDSWLRTVRDALIDTNAPLQAIIREWIAQV